MPLVMLLHGPPVEHSGHGNQLNITRHWANIWTVWMIPNEWVIQLSRNWATFPLWKCDLMGLYTSSTRTRRGGSCLKDIYKTFLIYRTCMRRAPAKPVRACTLRKWCPVSHVTCEAPLRPSHFSLQSSHSTLHTSHFTLHTSHFTLRSSQSTLHTSLHASHCTLHTSHFTLHTSHFTLHTSHCTLHAPHFTLHSSHSTLHLIWALLTLSQLISSHLFSYVT